MIINIVLPYYTRLKATLLPHPIVVNLYTNLLQHTGILAEIDRSCHGLANSMLKNIEFRKKLLPTICVIKFV